MGRPDRFYRGVPFEEAAARPILYYLFITILVALFNLWWTAIFTAMNVPFFSTEPETWGSLSPAANALFGFFATPFFAFFGLLLWSGLLQALVVLFARERRGYRATLRCVCYASGPQVLSAVPILGGLVGLAWSLVLTGIGLRHAHRMSPSASLAVVVLAAGVPLVMLIGFVMVLIASLAAIT